MIYKKIYTATTGHIKSADTQAIGEFLERIKVRTPEKILEEVKNHPNHVIYGYVFDCTDRDAVYQYRLDRVRWIMRHIIYKIDKSESKTNVRLFYNIVNSDGDKEYKTMDEVFSKPEFSNQVIGYALDELNGWCDKYEVYKELGKIAGSIRKNIKKIKR
jgi:hypothetical protein